MVLCRRYDTGGGWFGFLGVEALVAAAANGVSKARAARRTRGTALVAQVRYAWVKSVGWMPKGGWLGHNELRIVFRVPSGDGEYVRCFLDLALDGQSDPSAIAQFCAQRVGAYRLTHTGVDTEEERAGLEDLTAADPLPVPGKRRFAMYDVPGSYAVGAGTAYPMGEPAEAG